MQEIPVIIVGGGAAGLAAAGALKHHGIDSIIFDKTAKTGDIWRNRYERLHLHTMRELSYMPYFKMPGTYPRYPSKNQFADYMQSYAEHFDLKIEHGVSVTKAYRQGENWAVDVDTPSSTTWLAPHMIIATGLNRIPHIPNWPHLDHYKGQFMHSSEYSTGADFAGKRVLVIGCGNSGAEICADLVENGATQVACSIRTFPMIVPRDFIGLPIHGLGVFLSLLPGRLKDLNATLISRLALGDLTKHGLKKPEWQIFKDGRIPMIDVGFVEYVKKGRIDIRPNVKDFGETGVTYEGDQHPESFDAVIAATGFRTGLQEFLDVPDVYDDDGNLTVECGEPNHHNGLWFVGLEDSPAGVLMAARIQARKIGKYIAEAQGIAV